jgi:hypothetical protein
MWLPKQILKYLLQLAALKIKKLSNPAFLTESI